LPPGGALIDVAVLFADVRGSTTIGARMDAASYAALMNRFYRVATSVLTEHDAIIDKLIGDEVMALFFEGSSGSAYRRRAVEAAIDLLAAVRDKAGPAWLEVGAAVHAGPAFVGNVGGGGVSDFTALGDTVNTAARLQSFASSGELVLSEEAYQAVAERYPDAAARRETVRGKDEPITVRTIRAGSASGIRHNA
jgi:adenylate cyclase